MCVMIGNRFLQVKIYLLNLMMETGCLFWIINWIWNKTSVKLDIKFGKSWGQISYMSKSKRKKILSYLDNLYMIFTWWKRQFEI